MLSAIANVSTTRPMPCRYSVFVKWASACLSD